MGLSFRWFVGLLGQLVDRFFVGLGDGLLVPAELIFVAVDFFGLDELEIWGSCLWQIVIVLDFEFVIHI